MGITGQALVIPRNTSAVIELPGTPGDVITNTTLSSVEFREDLPSSHFDVREGATVLEGYGTR